jgi:hypothetical protein
MPDTETTEATTVVSAEVDNEAPDDDATVDQKPTVAGESADEDQGGDERETFPRSYVVKLRTENDRYREPARSADQYGEAAAHRVSPRHRPAGRPDRPRVR